MGDSVRLECNASGDQPISVNWLRDGSNDTIDKHGNSLYDIHETPIEGGLLSFLQIRELKPEDGLMYKCQAKNEFGSSERLLKLIVLNPPERPSQLKSREIWSRSALVSWQSPQLAGSRITNYTIQYWRLNQASPVASVGSQSNLQNHRRESIQVDGLQNSAYLVNLMPSLTYEVSVIAHNQVGQSEPSESIIINTSEEEPSAPPSDVVVEPKGSTTLRVTWKIPPLETLNGKLLGFYVGYRPRNLQQTPQSSLLASSLQQILPSTRRDQSQQTQGSQNQQVFSYKTADAYEAQLYYDIFLIYLKSSQDYEITVRAFNKAGSGPDCHTIVARTNGPHLPPAPSLQVLRSNQNSIQLKWTSSPVMSSHHASLQQAKAIPTGHMTPFESLARFILYYQLQGEREWGEISVESSGSTIKSQPLMLNQLMHENDPMSLSDSNLGISSNSNDLNGIDSSVHTLSNLRPGSSYRIYVAAVSEYGVGDPSNVVSIKTEPVNGTLWSTGSSNLLPTLADGQLSLGATQSTSMGLFDNLSSHQQQYGLVLTSLSSIGLLAILLMLVGYLLWHRRCHVKYNSSSGSSYPSSWTQATGDTFQSEYSIKRIPSGQSQVEVQDDPNKNRQQRTMQLAVGSQQININSSGSNARRMRDLTGARGTINHFGLVPNRLNAARQFESGNHYHQPADLLSGTMQISQQHSRNKYGQHSQPPTASTLNRNHQSRQLPPIPYSTLSVKEIQGTVPSKGWRAIPTATLIAANSAMEQKQQQQLCNQANTIGSQSPLIYGVIE